MSMIDYLNKNYVLTNGQQMLIEKLNDFLFSNYNVFLLKGYAGTGKTFITKGVTEYLKILKRNFCLCAPTGKAAMVISKKTNTLASTIHKVIYSEKDIIELKNDNDKTLKSYFNLRNNYDPNDTIYIIDEASMVSDNYSEMEFFRFGSGFLLKDLLDYINLDCNDHRKKIIFIGDNAQLPPVKMSFSPALNKKYLEEKYKLRVDEFELTDIVRQKQDSGILQNTLPIRNSIKNNIFNKLEIKINNKDVNELEHQNFFNTYLNSVKDKINQNTIVIAHSNASVKEYNDKIREYFFPNNNTNICSGDLLMIVRNHYIGELLLTNGEIVEVLDVGEREYRNVSLPKQSLEEEFMFRDLTIIVKKDNSNFALSCKVIENLLYSKQSSLNSDQTKALYVDFLIRNQHLKPSTKEWKDTLRSDPYFNALKVKFGYAITCHKAQGSEWDNVFLNCSYTQSKMSKEYFRWLYTAQTRASQTLYLLNKPEFMPFNANNFEKILNKNPSDINSQQIQDNFLNSKIFTKAKEILSYCNIEIKDIKEEQYCEIFTLYLNNKTSRVKIYYDKNEIISNINFIETNSLSQIAMVLLQPLIGQSVSKQKKEFVFTKGFLKELYLFLEKVFIVQNIQILDIKNYSFMQKYSLKDEENKICIVNIYYNNKEKISNVNFEKADSQKIVDLINQLDLTKSNYE